MTTHVVFEADGHLFALPTTDVARFDQRAPGGDDVGWTVELVSGDAVAAGARPRLRTLTGIVSLPRHLSWWSARGLAGACRLDGRMALLASPRWFRRP